MRDRVGDELVELLSMDHATGDQRRDALDRREQDEADALGLTGFEAAAVLSETLRASAPRFRRLASRSPALPRHRLPLEPDDS
jgi:hypothetical protein